MGNKEKENRKRSWRSLTNLSSTPAPVGTEKGLEFPPRKFKKDNLYCKRGPTNIYEKGFNSL